MLNKLSKRYISAILTVVMSLLGFDVAMAFAPDTYTTSSRLSTGRWVKIKVPTSGMYIMSSATLQGWGFSDPKRVRVYGYGGQQLPNRLTQSDYIDDLPLAMCEWTDRGLVFYAHGPSTLSASGTGNWTSKPNYYSTAAYYFVGEATDDELSVKPAVTGTPGFKNSQAATVFTEVAIHETELVSPGSTGHNLLGEDFAQKRTQSFSFNLPDRADDRLWVQTVFGIKALNGTSNLAVTVNDVALPGSGRVEGRIDDSHFHYALNSLSGTMQVPGQKVDVKLAFTSSANPIRLARLDKITLNYSRKLQLGSTPIEFRLSGTAALQGATTDTRVWDVTTPAHTMTVQTELSDGAAVWTPADNTYRQYVAWNPTSTMPSPTAVKTVDNQNLHGLEVPHMIIFTLPQYAAQAEAIASLHRNDPVDPLDVVVITQDEAFNEFSSGTPDYQAMRRCAKMLYDRGTTADGGSKLRYCLMFGRAFYDHRGITPLSAQAQGNLLLQWQTEGGGDSTSSYTTEDFMAFLQDDSGTNLSGDYHCIGVGRIPVQTTAEANATVDKLRAYMDDNNKEDWKNRVILATDDGNANVHIDQMEQAYSLMTATGGGRQYLYHKVYVDAFNIVDGVAVDAHERMMRLLKQGVGWWWYIGHAAATSWTADGLLTYSDIVNARFNHSPMLFAATCDFLRWDNSDESGAETLFFNPNGIIGAIAASRPVMISYNVNMSLAMARAMAANADAGGALALGDLLAIAKNDIRGEENKLRYVLMGDPALRLTFPHYRAVVDEINDVPLDGDEQPVIMARQNAVVTGHLVDPEGNTVTDFNGSVYPTLYDAEYSTTSQAHIVGDEAQPDPRVFEEMGERLYVGRDPVVDGEFTIKMSMPGDIASNYRPATLNVYALSDDGKAEAIGVTRDFYVYGYDDTANDDTTPPVIEQFVINSEQFRSGDNVNPSPMVIARVSDDTAINISSAGIGHQLSLLLDGKTSYPDVYLYYTPGLDGAKSGSLHYKLNDLAEGSHTLRLRVWDTAGNFNEETIDFNVVDDLSPSILRLYADCNPAVDHTNFIVRHNRPDEVVRVDVSVYDLLGRLVWTGSQSGTSTLNTALPIYWNLHDRGGRRVPRGIYVYRAVVSTAGGRDFVSASSKIAVTAP